MKVIDIEIEEFFENKKVTVVNNCEAKYGRTAYLSIVGDEVIFDNSQDEYGPIILDLQLLKDKIVEHEQNMAPK